MRTNPRKASTFDRHTYEEVSESHRFIHRFTHRFLIWVSRIRWNKGASRVLLLRALKVERPTEHGAPATSVAGVYSFRDVMNRHPELVSGTISETRSVLHHNGC